MTGGFSPGGHFCLKGLYWNDEKGLRLKGLNSNDEGDCCPKGLYSMMRGIVV